MEAPSRQPCRFGGNRQTICAVTLCVGFVERNPAGPSASRTNSVAVLQNGRIIWRTTKNLLPAYDTFDEDWNFIATHLRYDVSRTTAIRHHRHATCIVSINYQAGSSRAGMRHKMCLTPNYS